MSAESTHTIAAVAICLDESLISSYDWEAGCKFSKSAYYCKISAGLYYAGSSLSFFYVQVDGTVGEQLCSRRSGWCEIYSGQKRADKNLNMVCNCMKLRVLANENFGRKCCKIF